MQGIKGRRDGQPWVAFFGAVAMALAVPQACAAEAAGIVKTLKGQAVVMRDGQRLPLAVGDALFDGERVRTGQGSSLGITLRDDSLITAGANASLRIDRFAFNPSTHEGNMVVSVLRGAAVFVTGLIARAQPQNVEVRAVQATIGVRGTEFVVEVMDADAEVEGDSEGGQ